MVPRKIVIKEHLCHSNTAYLNVLYILRGLKINQYDGGEVFVLLPMTESASWRQEKIQGQAEQ